MKKWIIRAPNTEITAKTNQLERGSFIVFEPSTWEKVKKDNFTLFYNQIESRVSA